jgi:hypothetical protein
MSVFRGKEIQINAFLTDALDGDEWSDHAPAVLPPTPIRYRRLGGPKSQSGCGGEEKKPSLLLPGIELRSPARSLVSVLTEQKELNLNVFSISKSQVINVKNYGLDGRGSIPGRTSPPGPNQLWGLPRSLDV